MDDMERFQHELHAKLSAFQRKVEHACQILDEAREKGIKWYIAYSSGVDSLVVLHMLYSAGCHVDVLFGDDGFDYRESLQFLAETEECYGFHLQRIRCMQPWRDWCVEMDGADLCNDPEALQAWGNPHYWNDTWESLKDAVKFGYSGVFLGLLASESRTRTYALKGGAGPLYRVKSEGDMWHCSPLAAWTKQDVWSYIVSRNVSYNPVYGKLAELNVPLDRRRVAPLTCFRAMQYGSHGAILKSIDPGLYNRLCSIFPKVKSYS